ncbi:MAG: sugar ABC transporter ATP-binding protein [Sulfobacillus thermotolerans]|nr:sugar ABC transporter ATP-binding protein [Sulfobacillus thermotolerans]
MAISLGVEHISKRFPGVIALNDVTWKAQGGEILGLVGENGAGKSTLIKILAGAQKADGGQLILDGVPVVWRNPAEAMAHGVAVIYQELTAIPNISVEENIVAGRWPRTAWGMIRRDEIREIAKRLLDDVGLKIDPSHAMRDLSLGQQQLVEIAKALGRDVSVLIMDEPTSSLTPGEVEHLFNIMRKAAERNILVLYVSHKLEEILEICSRAIVLRDGRIIDDRPISEWSEDSLITAMVSRKFSRTSTDRKSLGYDEDSVALDLNQFQTVSGVRVPHLTVFRQEILGLAGLVGAGRTDVLQALSGSMAFKGNFELFGRVVSWGSPADAIHEGIVLVPEDRQAEALVGTASVETNLTLALLEKCKGSFGIFRRQQARDEVRPWARQFEVPDDRWQQPIRQFSGGMQQKVILSRVLATKPRVLLLDEPTRGIDVATKADIYEAIEMLRQQGLTIVIASSELPELFRVCDRIAVFSQKTFRTVLTAVDTTQEEIMRYATTSE